MQIDVLTLITPDPSIIKTQGLQGSTPSWTYLSDPDANGMQDLVYIKGQNVNPAIPGGYPWDWLKVGQDYIYQLLTENKWSDPSTGKLMFGLGSARLPRVIDYSLSQPPGAWSFTIDRPHTDYVIYGPGALPTSRSSDASVKNTIRGPFPGAAIGDLPAGTDWQLDYEWSGKLNTAGQMIYGTLERITVRQGYGRYQWQSFPSDGKGGYATTPTSSSQTTKILLTPCPTPVQKIF